MLSQTDGEAQFELTDLDNRGTSLMVFPGFNNMCRFCLSRRDGSVNIFEVDSANEVIGLLELLLNTNISETDNLPQYICQDCQKFVNSISNFKSKCQKTETILRKYVDCVPQNDSSLSLDVCESERLDFADGENSELASSQIVHPLSKSRNLNNLKNIKNTDRRKTTVDYTKKTKKDVRRERVNTAHELVYGAELLKRQKCSECSAECRNVGALIKHRLRHHGPKKFQCLECGNGFTTMRGLRFHLRIHSGDKREVCSICGRCFTDPRTRIKHELRHRSEMPHTCEECPRSFDSRASLSRHVATSHPEPGVVVVSTHQCTVCAKSYMHPHSLKVHMRKHNGSRPYACNHCERKFTNGTSLAAHVRSHNIFAVSDHRAGKKSSSIRHSCSKCPRTFKMSAALTSHMLTHTGLKNYMCANCGVCVARSSELAVHMKTHTRKVDAGGNERVQNQSPASNVAQDLRVAIPTKIGY